MKQPAALRADLSDFEIEALAAEAFHHRRAAREACVMACLLRAAGIEKGKGGARWWVREAARLQGVSVLLDGTGTEGPQQ